MIHKEQKKQQQAARKILLFQIKIIVMSESDFTTSRKQQVLRGSVQTHQTLCGLKQEVWEEKGEGGSHTHTHTLTAVFNFCLLKQLKVNSIELVRGERDSR